MIIKVLKMTWKDIVILLALIPMLFYSAKLCYIFISGDIVIGYIGNLKYEKIS